MPRRAKIEEQIKQKTIIKCQSGQLSINEAARRLGVVKASGPGYHEAKAKA